MPNQTLEFNSGRYYGPGGQQIRAILVRIMDDKVPEKLLLNQLYVQDKTRRITFAKCVDFSKLTPDIVMQEYDAGSYDPYPEPIFNQIWIKLTEGPHASI